MVLQLVLEDGRSKEYSTFFNRHRILHFDDFATKCGMEWKHPPKKDDQCNHIDCAIAAYKKKQEYFYKLALTFFALAIYFVAFDLLYGHTAHWASFFMVILGLGTLKISSRFDHDVTDLKEFRDLGTINGIRAKII